MEFKSWGISFPTIIDGLGAERVMEEAAAMGQSEFLLCSTIYRGYRLVMPRHPCQIYQLETGVNFYPTEESFYQGCDIRPVSTRDFAGRDLFEQAARAAEKNNITLGAWVACFANGRIAAEYPHHAVQNLYGSRDRLFLCFNDPEVQKFVLAMACELSNRYRLASIMADKIPQSMLELDSFGGRIDPLFRLVGSLCFCEHCMARASQDGVDLQEAKRRALQIAEASRKVPQYVRESLASELHGDTEIPLFLLEEPLFAEVLQWRMRCVVDFLKRMRSEIRKVNPECKISACLVPPVKIGHDATAPRAWLGAQSYRLFAPVVDTLHAVIHWSPEVVAYDTRRVRDAIDSTNPGCELAVHLSIYGRRRPEELAPLVHSALSQGADSIAFFCHDLLDDGMINAIKALKETP